VRASLHFNHLIACLSLPTCACPSPGDGLPVALGAGTVGGDAEKLPAANDRNWPTPVEFDCKTALAVSGVGVCQGPHEPCLGIRATCILSLFIQKDRDGTGKEEARRQENHFCQTSQKDGKRQKAPQVRRHPAPEGGDSNFDASGVLTTRASRSRQAASAWSLALCSSDPTATPTPGAAVAVRAN
jgi:hypothetical protein